MAPMLAAETLPYSVGELAGVVADVLQHRAQVLEVEQQQAVVVGDLEDDVEHAFLRVVELRAGAPAAAGPSRRSVARTGWPCSPKTSQNVTGQAGRRRSRRARAASTRSSTFGLSPPGWRVPDRSPFTSAMKTGTPMRLKRSARTCSVTVLPVPVAPAMRPWRLAICGSSRSGGAFGEEEGVAGHEYPLGSVVGSWSLVLRVESIRRRRGTGEAPTAVVRGWQRSIGWRMEIRAATIDDLPRWSRSTTTTSCTLRSRSTSCR